MKRAFSLLLIFVLGCFGQTSLNIPSGYTSSQTFYYKGQIYVVLDARGTRNLYPQIATINNQQWSKFANLANVCTPDYPCYTYTDDVLVQGNMAYISFTESFGSFNRVFMSVNLDNLQLITSAQSPQGFSIQSGFFIPGDNNFAYYFFERVFSTLGYQGTQFSLQTLQWTGSLLDFSDFGQYAFIPFNSNTIISCGYQQCTNYNTVSGVSTKFTASVDCLIRNYIPSSQTLICVQEDTNTTNFNTYSVQSNSVAINMTLTLSSNEVPTYAAVNAKTNTAFVTTNLPDNSNVLYQIDLGLFQVTKRTPLQFPTGYYINSYNRMVSTQTGGTLVLTIIPEEWESKTPSQVLLISV